MKNLITILLTLTSFYSLTSCNQTEQKKEAPVENPSSSLMTETTYDASKIDPAAPVTEIKLLATGNNMAEMKFNLTEVKVKSGCTVKLTLVNEATDASMQHNFVLIDLGSADSVAAKGLKAGVAENYVPKSKEVYVATNVTPPGKSTTIIFPAPEKGIYEFICTYPGHYTMMRGKFIVE